MTAAECGNMVISRKTKLESIDLCDGEASVRFDMYRYLTSEISVYIILLYCAKSRSDKCAYPG